MENLEFWNVTAPRLLAAENVRIIKMIRALSRRESLSQIYQLGYAPVGILEWVRNILACARDSAEMQIRATLSFLRARGLLSGSLKRAAGNLAFKFLRYIVGRLFHRVLERRLASFTSHGYCKGQEDSHMRHSASLLHSHVTILILPPRNIILI